MSIDQRERLSEDEVTLSKKGMVKLEEKLNLKGRYAKIVNSETSRQRFIVKGPFEFALATSEAGQRVLSSGVSDLAEMGYKRYICYVGESGEPFALGVGGEPIPFSENEEGKVILSFGRVQEKCDLVVGEKGDTMISRKHGTILYQNGKFLLEDSSSYGHGTYCREISKEDVDKWWNLTRCLGKNKKKREGMRKETGSKEKTEGKESEGSPSITYEGGVFDGRAREDVVKVVPKEVLAKSRLGVSFMAAVLDGHSGEPPLGKEFAEKVLPYLWRHLNKQETLSKEAIKSAVQATSQELIDLFRSYGEDRVGACMDAVLATSKGLILIQVGDGKVFWGKSKSDQIKEVEMKSHRVDVDSQGRLNRIFGLAVRKSLGDVDVKERAKVAGRQSEQNACPDVYFFSWDYLRKKKVDCMFLSTDGLSDLGEESLGLVKKSVKFGLRGKVFNFESEVEDLKDRYWQKELEKVAETEAQGGEYKPNKADDVGVLLIRF